MAHWIHTFLHFVFYSTDLFWCYIFSQVQHFINALSLLYSLDNLTACISSRAKFFGRLKLGSCIILDLFRHNTLGIWDTRVHPMVVDNYSTIAIIEFPHFAGWTLNMYGWCTTTVANVLSTTNLKLHSISFKVLFKIDAVIINTLV